MTRRARIRRIWTEAEKAVVRARFPHEPTRVVAQALGRRESQVSQCALRLRLKKTADYLASPAACRLRRGDDTGAATRFKAGEKPWNAGKQGWQAGGRSIETQFKPGHRGGRAAERYQPIGAERVTKDGIRQRKINDDLPLQARWKAVHALNWEAAHGPIPKGYLVVFRDGDRTNTALENLELISRIENLRRNSVHSLPPELASLCLLKGSVTRQINKRAKP